MDDRTTLAAVMILLSPDDLELEAARDQRARSSMARNVVRQARRALERDRRRDPDAPG
jgi:hypothetical protein